MCKKRFTSRARRILLIIEQIIVLRLCRTYQKCHDSITLTISQRFAFIKVYKSISIFILIGHFEWQLYVIVDVHTLPE